MRLGEVPLLTQPMAFKPSAGGDEGGTGGMKEGVPGYEGSFEGVEPTIRPEFPEAAEVWGAVVDIWA